MRVLSVLNQKGGVGKTTTAAAVAHGLALTGERVLAMDLDPQGHLGASLGADSDRPGMDGVLLDGTGPEDLMRPARERLQLLTAGRRLMQVEQQSTGGPERGWRLKQAIDAMTDVADWVVIDCPPSSGLLVMNGLLAADDLLVPVSSDFLALQGLSTLMQTLQRVESRLGG
ncbi:MAG: ParA family protein, partial [Phycisphaerae bacterium]